MGNRNVTLGQLFTDEELQRAFKICAETVTHQRNKKLVAEIVEPAIDRINKATGQENDPRYFGYMMEAAYNTLTLRPLARKSRQ